VLEKSKIIFSYIVHDLEPFQKRQYVNCIYGLFLTREIVRTKGCVVTLYVFYDSHAN